jgi:aspartyl-tRNA(Asn)/glutamyl-tRNA(Gln) amidotransferase subunit C
MSISEQDVAHVADLANLELTSGERARMLEDLNSILAYIAQLNELDTTSVPPMAQVGEQLGAWNGSASSDRALRADSLLPSLGRDRVLASAPDTDRVFFKVPKVIER